MTSSVAEIVLRHKIRMVGIVSGQGLRMVHPADGAHVASGNAAGFIAEILASGVQKRFEFGHNFGVLVMAGAETVSDAVVGQHEQVCPYPECTTAPQATASDTVAAAVYESIPRRKFEMTKGSESNRPLTAQSDGRKGLTPQGRFAIVI